MYVLLLLWVLPAGVSGLSCYSCENERSNFLCINEDNLVQCEEGMDTCQTIVSYSDVSAKLSIIKTCTKNVSCELQVNATAHLMPCDRSRNSWVCTTCCYDNACNVNAAIGEHAGIGRPYSWIRLSPAFMLSMQYCLQYYFAGNVLSSLLLSRDTL